jgi:hypothetical protein
MARTTKQLSGGGKDKFFRNLVGRVDGVPAAAAAVITAELIEQVTDIRVRRDTWQTLTQEAAPLDALHEAPVKRSSSARASAKATKGAVAGAAVLLPTPVSAPAVEANGVIEPLFDPFAFSAVAVLTRKGKPALVAALEGIVSVAQLHQLANAQHLAVDAAVDDPVALRAAILAGTERRIAERKAAAS